MSISLQEPPAREREPAPGAATHRVEPFLHYEAERTYNPLTGRGLELGEPGFGELRALADGTVELRALPAAVAERLIEERWVVEESPRLANRFRLKYVSFEAHTVCNQACYFCPVSIDRREDHFMPMELYERITAQLAEHRATIEGVSMIHYNEPTVDKRFLDQVRMLLDYRLPPAVLTNGTGLTPKRIDAILEMGGLKYLSINLSTLDRQRYHDDREGDHLKLVLRNVDYMKDLPVAPQMDLVVLGKGDATHRRDFEEISERFAGSRFEMKYYEVMDRAGNVPLGLKPPSQHERLCGCEQTGSRPVEWVHITPHGKCLLCCQDYHEHHVVGDLNHQSLDEILEGDEMAHLRRWVYGMEEAPEDFICRGCIYALTR